MLTSLNTGVSALDQFQQDINVIANNVANVNTVGFKSASADFEDALSETLGSSAAGSMQVGTGVTTSAILNDFTSGAINNTGVQSDLAITGNGFFVVKDSTSGNSYVTQDGQFTLDSGGYLVTSDGLRVQGSTGDIKIAGTATNPMTSYTIGTDGTVTVNLADGTSSSGGQITLQNFSSPDQLVKVGGNLYTAPASAGGLTTPAVPGTNGLGTVESGYLEMSNVDLASQLTSLITVQRAYEANAKIITTSDELLQDLVNLKR